MKMNIFFACALFTPNMKFAGIWFYRLMHFSFLRPTNWNLFIKILLSVLIPVFILRFSFLLGVSFFTVVCFIWLLYIILTKRVNHYIKYIILKMLNKIATILLYHYLISLQIYWHQSIERSQIMGSIIITVIQSFTYTYN